MARDFLYFDEIEDVLSSLDLLALTVPLVKRQRSYWKWVMVAAHSSLQGAMICALRDTAGISVLERDCGREMLEWFHHREDEPPNERLADFGTLLRRCRKARCMDGHPLKLSEVQTRDVRRLHREFRNEFAHFVPKGWSIEKAGLPRIIRAALDTTEMLMAHPRVVRKLSGNRVRRLNERLRVARANLK
jgi:hypothetical protein